MASEFVRKIDDTLVKEEPKNTSENGDLLITRPKVNDDYGEETKFDKDHDKGGVYVHIGNQYRKLDYGNDLTKETTDRQQGDKDLNTRIDNIKIPEETLSLVRLTKMNFTIDDKYKNNKDIDLLFNYGNIIYDKKSSNIYGTISLRLNVKNEIIFNNEDEANTILGNLSFPEIPKSLTRDQNGTFNGVTYPDELHGIVVLRSNGSLVTNYDMPGALPVKIKAGRNYIIFLHISN